MRRYVGFAAVIAAMALSLVVWKRSSAVVTSTDAVRSNTGISPYEIMSGSKNLPVQHIENPM
jgi:hypothetical protein